MVNGANPSYHWFQPSSKARYRRGELGVAWRVQPVIESSIEVADMGSAYMVKR